jgi:hypothetical protein
MNLLRAAVVQAVPVVFGSGGPSGTFAEDGP